MTKTVLVVGVFALITVLVVLFLTNDSNPTPLSITQVLNPTSTPTIIKSDSTSNVTGEVGIPLKMPNGFKIGLFATDLSAPRDLEYSPGGVLLASIPRTGKVVALPDKNNDGMSDQTVDVVSRLDNPHGLAFHNNKLFVAEETRLVRYSWDEATLKATEEKVLFQIPSAGGHITRTVVFKPNGQMFVSIGSTCNVCVEDHPWYASVIVSDQDGNNPRVYSKGLRNATFIARNPETEEIWVTEMGRDNLGDDIPPEEINILKDGGDYGWPYCYDNQVHDNNFDPRNQKSCENTISPIFKMQAHSAPLGLAFIYSPQFPSDWRKDLLVSFHGSWNRSTPTGYKVVKLNVEGNTITSQEDFLTGFTQGREVLGRPVDVIFDKAGALYVSDDKAGNIYKIVR